jgi:hypothetical protein
MRITSGGLGIGVTQTPLESSLVVAGQRAAYPTQAGCHLGLNGTVACLALASSGASVGSILDFGYAGMTQSQGQIYYSMSQNNFGFVVNNVTQAVMSNGAFAVGFGSAGESSLQVGGARVTYPTKTGVHLGINNSTLAATIALASVNSATPSYIDFLYNGVLSSSTNTGRLSFSCAAPIGWTFTQNTSTPLTILTAGVGCGSTNPTSALHVQGLLSSGPTYGVSCGMNPSATGNPVLCLSASSSSGTCYIGFTSNSYAYNHNGFISYSNKTNQMFFSTIQGQSFMLDGSTANNTLIVGAGSSGSTTPYRLYVAGTGLYAAVVAGGSKPFDIPHQSKPGWRLRHRAAESPQAQVFYHFKLDCVEGANTVNLPEYYSWLATDPIVHVTPYGCFGAGWGDVDAAGQVLTVTVNAPGSYRVTLFATRQDDMAAEEFADFGVERAA